MNRLTTHNSDVLLSLSLCLLVGLVWHVLPHPALPVVLALVPLVVLFVLRQPFLIVLSFVLFTFFRLHEAFRVLEPLHIPQLLAVASLAVLAWHLFLTKQIDAYWSRELSVFALFFALVTLGVFFASNRAEAMTYWTGTYVKIGVMVVAIAWLTRTSKDFALAARLIVVSGIAISAVALFNKANGIGLVEGTRVTIARDIGSLIGDPNDLALVLLFPASFALSQLLTPGVGKLDRLLGLIGIGMLPAAIIATQSRGGLLGIAAVLGIFAWRRIKSRALLLMISGIVMAGLFTVAGIAERSSGGSVETGIDASAMGRVYAWGAAFRMALANPFTGVGVDNFYVNYFFYSSYWDGKNHAVHSTWFGVLAETGFLGLIVFVTLIVLLVTSSQRAVAELVAAGDCAPPALVSVSQAVQAGLVGVIISGTFLTHGFTWPIYILAAFVVAINQYVQRRIAPRKLQSNAVCDSG